MSNNIIIKVPKTITMGSVHKYTPLQIIGYVKNKLLKQKYPSLSEYSGCCYEQKGLKCAVGHLIAEKDIKNIKLKGLNDIDVSTLIEEYFYKTRISKKKILLLERLQTLHDNVKQGYIFNADMFDEIIKLYSTNDITFVYDEAK